MSSTVSITLPVKSIRAVAPARAIKDVRYYLEGILLEHNGAETVLVATDGHRMHVMRHEGPRSVSCDVKVIIPASMVQAIIKSCTAKAAQTAEVTLYVEYDRLANDGDPLPATMKLALPGGTWVHADAIDGVYPDWRRVIPKAAATGEPCAINPNYLRDAMECHRELIGSKTYQIGVKHNGNDSVYLYDAEAGYLAIIMPLRAPVCDMPVPASFYAPMQAPEVV